MVDRPISELFDRFAEASAGMVATWEGRDLTRDPGHMPPNLEFLIAAFQRAIDRHTALAVEKWQAGKYDEALSDIWYAGNRHGELLVNHAHLERLMRPAAA